MTIQNIIERIEGRSERNDRQKKTPSLINHSKKRVELQNKSLENREQIQKNLDFIFFIHN